jgi:hypothetical protein
VPSSTILWLVLLGVLAVLFVVTLRRMSALIARTRTLERFQRGVDSVERRFGAFALPLVKLLDDTRRSPGDPAFLRTQVAEAIDVLTVLRAEVHDLPVPAQLARAAAVLEGELDRAASAPWKGRAAAGISRRRRRSSGGP